MPVSYKTVLRVLGEAVKDLDGMRRREGEALAKDLAIHSEALRTAKISVAKKAPGLAQEAFDRMKTRVQALLHGEVPDQARLLQELAVYADRSDLSEELVRLSHICYSSTRRSEVRSQWEDLGVHPAGNGARSEHDRLESE